MSRLIDEAGNRHNRLVVIERHPIAYCAPEYQRKLTALVTGEVHGI